MFKFIFLMLFSMVASANTHTNSCVVLLYHHFSDRTPKSTSISPQLFEQQLQYLQNHDFQVLPLKTMLIRLKAKTLPNKCVVLTADDAYQSIATNAYPLLKKYQMSMSVFVATDAVDNQYQATMSWQQMRDIQGITIQFYNHTSSHIHLLDLDAAQVKGEIKNAQSRLNKMLGVQEKILSYPYGEANAPILKQVENLGYVAFGQHSGVVSPDGDLQNLPRFPMAANFAKMTPFKLKVNTLPMPLVATRPNTVIGEKNPPTLTLTFKKPLNDWQQKQFNCFANGGTHMTWKNKQTVLITAKKPLFDRRTKYNCTLPNEQDNRYYWYSVQWVNSQALE